MDSETLILAEIEAETLRHIKAIAQLRRSLAAARANRAPSPSTPWRPPPVEPVARRAMELVAIFTHVTPAEILGRKRPNHISVARHLVWYLIRHALPTLPVQKIALIFQRNHATILHGLRHIENLRETDHAFAALLARLLQQWDSHLNPNPLMKIPLS